MASKRVLIVEDEIVQQRLLLSMADKAGFDATLASSGQEGLDRLEATVGNPFDVILLDQNMPGMSGLDMLKTLRHTNVKTPVIILTGQASITTVVDAMRAGATDFIVKPASAERLRTALQAAVDGSSLAGDVVDDLAARALPATRAASADGFKSLVGDSPALKSMKKLGIKAAETSIPVLIEGESGVGKEVFARAIHADSTRARQKFVAVNCGAIPENLVESILFGHEKGAFTGATEQRTGVFKEADGGTLFLDEVGELPLDVQVKLLRALQEREITPVGSKASVKVDIRVISATNRTLTNEVTRGSFREDLYYRLNVFPIVLPPLRDRLEDIPDLAATLLDRLARTEGMAAKSLSQAAKRHLVGYPWPGNIRQLQNALFRAVVLSDQPLLEPADFPLINAPSEGDFQRESKPLEISLNGGLERASPSSSLEGGLQAPLKEALALATPDHHIRPLAALERDIIAAALRRYDGRITEVARRLDIGRSTLYRKIALYGLEEIAAS